KNNSLFACNLTKNSLSLKHMIKTNKIIEVRIQEWSTHWAVKIFDQGIDSEGNDRPRVRTASSLSHLNKIKRQENLNSPRFNVVTQRRHFNA
ncbi:MAG: hypothetical protein EBR72_09000, partial [Bacteroidetes bacterium]|nr:hypothetical protein [Bacteroidota bacterium]